MSVKMKMTYVFVVWVYAVLVGPLAGFVVYRLNALVKDGLADNDIARMAGFIIVFTALYVMRAALLTLPLLTKNTKLRKMSTYGLIAVLIPELMVFYTVVHFTITPPTPTTNPSNWADALAPLVVLVPLAFSTCAQLIGMTIGWLVTFIKRQ